MAHGATVLPTFEPDQVTHILACDGGVTLEHLLRRTGFKSLDAIPEHVPVLRWSWVEESWKKHVLAPVHEHPAFKTRITYPPDYVPPPTEEKPAASSSTPLPPRTDVKPTKQRHADPEDSDDSSYERTS